MIGQQDVQDRPPHPLRDLHQHIQEGRRTRPTHDIVTQPIKKTIVPVVLPTAATKGGLKIIQKVNVKQNIKSKKSLRKTYSKLRREIIKLLKKRKSAEYAKHNALIKQKPSKQRVAERKALRQRLKVKLDALLKQLPAKVKKSDLQAFISKVRSIKW